jgi:alpha-L-arabinofuranosidase
MATTDSRKSSLSLFVINREWRNTIPAIVQVNGFSPGSQATLRTLNSDSVLTSNDEEHPDRVKPVATTLAVSGSSFHYDFPAHSVTEISFSPGAQASR